MTQANFDREALHQAIAQIPCEALSCQLGDIAQILIEHDGDSIALNVRLGFAANSIKSDLEQQLSIIAQQHKVELKLNWLVQIQTHQTNNKGKPIQRVKNIIAVASGKGGVGKSTTAANLAIALQKQGAEVGILDADIYGPSQALIFNLSDTKPGTRENKYFVPPVAWDIPVMSMGFLVNESTPTVWRGPMASGAFQQLATQTLWPELDYLIIDMPPGTGDIQLTLAQQLAVSGSVIVTTPQTLAVLDGQKGIETFRKVDVPVLGVVENMSTHICSQCGHEDPLFGSGGGAQIAEEYDTELLAQIPLNGAIREAADSGQPTVISQPDSAEAQRYQELALKVGWALAKRPRQTAIPSVNIHTP